MPTKGRLIVPTVVREAIVLIEVLLAMVEEMAVLAVGVTALVEVAVILAEVPAVEVIAMVEATARQAEVTTAPSLAKGITTTKVLPLLIPLHAQLMIVT